MSEHPNLWIRIFSRITVPEGHWFEEIRHLPEQIATIVYEWVALDIAHEIVAYV
jgi:hypothetical protein